MSGHISEYVVNVKLAQILSKLGIDARAERVERRKRPDIRCYYKGFIIGIEASYSKSDAEKDAERRIKQGLVDIAIALWIKKKYPNVREEELEELIRESKFDVKIFVPVESEKLTKYLEKEIKKKAEPATGWFTDVDLPTLESIIELSINFIVKEEVVISLIEELKQKIDDFTNSLKALDSKGDIRKGIYDILYKLYGFSIEERDPDIAFGHAALSILLSVSFYEHIRSNHTQLKPIKDYTRRYGAIEGLIKAFEDLLKIDYKVVVDTTIKILRILPSGFAHRVEDLVDLGIKIAQNKGLLKRDFAGRIYHEITGNIAVRKGFATYYTEMPAAYLLATLATHSLLELDKKEIQKLNKNEAHKIIEKIKNTKIADLACGSGTLLTASYHLYHRILSALKYYHDLDIDIDEISKILVENNIYGIDALKYASQITAINLALIGPSTITKENIYTIYLGYIPEKNQAWLGSLELLNNGKRVGGILAYIEGGLDGIAEKVSLESVEGVFSIPNKFQMIIMNPPFTRATGRTRSFDEVGADRGLFGFIVDEKARKMLLDAYRKVRDRVRDELMKIAQEEIHLFPDTIKELILKRPKELRQYLNIGQAGESLLFLYLAYKYIDNNGVIAFVLPKNVLAGVSWFLIRVLLATKFHVKYVVVSSDPEKGYNFSEGTSLSETLIVAKRVNEHTEDEETVFVTLLSKPSTALEAIMLGEEIVKRSLSKDSDIIEVGNSRALVFKVKREDLLKCIDNWNRFVAIPDIKLLDIVRRLSEEDKIEFLHGIKIPIVTFNELINMLGIDAHQFHDNFKVVETSTPYPVVHGGHEKIREKMLVHPNAYVVPKIDKGEDIFKNYRGKILVPDRIPWNTTHAIALYSQEPVLSNVFYAVKLKVPREIEEYANKALVLWFNTVWGLLTVLVNRQETGGAWTRLKMGQWKLLPVLNVNKLDKDTLKRLANIFDKYSNKPLRRIPYQFDPQNPDPVRLRLDIEFLKALCPELDEEVIKGELLELYKRIHIAIRTWIGQ